MSINIDDVIETMERQIKWYATPLDFFLCGALKELKSLRAKLEAVEKQRPHWAKGYSTDSIAAQVSAGALSKLWELLGVSSQTDAVEKLQRLVLTAPNVTAAPDAATPEMEAAAEKYWNERRLKGLSSDPRTWAGVYAAMRAVAPPPAQPPVTRQDVLHALLSTSGKPESFTADTILELLQGRGTVAAPDAMRAAAPPHNRQPVTRQDLVCAVAAIEYAINTEEGLEFLKHWFYGDFDVLRRSWDNIPDEVFIGADPLFNSSNSQ